MSYREPIVEYVCKHGAGSCTECLIEAYEEKIKELESGLRLNDIVQVNCLSKYYSDWKDMDCRVVGLCYPRKFRDGSYGELDITILDLSSGCEADGWKLEELTKVER